MKGRCFDIGNATRSALNRFKQKPQPFCGDTGPHSAGNGSLMRLAPAPLAVLDGGDHLSVGAERDEQVIELEFTEDAVRAVAQRAHERQTGARGLRSIIEDMMLDLMYSLPGQKKIRECVITREVVESKEKPITVIEKAG